MPEELVRSKKDYPACRYDDCPQKPEWGQCHQNCPKMKKHRSEIFHTHRHSSKFGGGVY